MSSDLVEKTREIVAGDCHGLGEAACRVGCECRDRAVQVIALVSASFADRIEALEMWKREAEAKLVEVAVALGHATNKSEALEAENARLRGALEDCKPFVYHFKGGWSSHTPGNVSATELFGQITAALKGQSDEIMERAGEHVRNWGGGVGDRKMVAAAIMEAEARGREREREACAKVADEIMTTADGKFDLRVLRAKQGEDNLELAAACAAGMSHAAREIATVIRSKYHE